MQRGRVAKSPVFDWTVQVFYTRSSWQFHSKPDRWKSGILFHIFILTSLKSSSVTQHLATVKSSLDRRCFRVQNARKSFSTGALPWTPLGKLWRSPIPSWLGREMPLTLHLLPRCIWHLMSSPFFLVWSPGNPTQRFSTVVGWGIALRMDWLVVVYACTLMVVTVDCVNIL